MGPMLMLGGAKGSTLCRRLLTSGKTREQLLDNNFRNMMRRDREDPRKGSEYVDREYPKRAAFCVPILIDACNAFDVSKKATPEMEAAGKKPGRNLADKLLNEPGMPLRCCVVLRVSGEDGAAWMSSRSDILLYHIISYTYIHTYIYYRCPSSLPCVILTVSRYGCLKCELDQLI